MLPLVLVLVLAVTFTLPGAKARQVRTIVVTATQYQFDPSRIEVEQGDEVHIILRSGDVEHGLYIDGYDIRTEANSQHDGYLNFTADMVGKFKFRCAVVCGQFHPYMIGELVVKAKGIGNYYFYIFSALAVLVPGLMLVSHGRGRAPERG